MCAPLEAGRENEELDTVKYTGVGGVALWSRGKMPKKAHYEGTAEKGSGEGVCLLLYLRSPSVFHCLKDMMD